VFEKPRFVELPDFVHVFLNKSHILTVIFFCFPRKRVSCFEMAYDALVAAVRHRAGHQDALAFVVHQQLDEIVAL